MIRLWLLFICSLQLLHASLLLTNDTLPAKNFKLSYYYDISNTQDINDIQNISFDKELDSQFALGYLDGTSWFKIDLTNQSETEDFILYFTEPSTERFNLYTKEDGKWSKQELGFLTPMDEREIYDANPVFQLHLKQGQSKTYYIQFYAKFSHIGEFQLYDLKSFLTHDKMIMTNLYLFYFGALLMIILLNAFLFLRLGEIIYAYYAAYVGFFFLFIIIFAGFDILAGFGEWHYPLHFSVPMVMFFLILFSSHFLELKQYMPRIDNILKTMIFAYFIFAILIFISVDPWYEYMNHLSTLAFIILLWASVYMSTKGHKAAQYYLVIMLPNIIFLGLMANVFTGQIENNDLNRYGFLFTSFFEINFFALILANRFYETKELANRDPLTGLYNRRYFAGIANDFVHNAIRYQHPLTLFMIDIDDFKVINDTYGHDVGDDVIIKLSRLLKKHARESDIIVRFGGEEFVILLPETSLLEAQTLASRILRQFSSEGFQIANKELELTISIGLAEFNRQRDHHIEDLIKKADLGLYKAKESGKNQIITFEHPVS